MGSVYIYALKCPKTQAIRYIGKANNVENRLKGHLRDAKRRNTPLYQWIRQLNSESLTPIADVLIITENWEDDEKRMIAQYREAGHDLLNLAKGGNQPYCKPEVLAENGRKTAANRNEILWRAKRNMGANMQFLKKHDMKEAYNRIAIKLMRVGIIYQLI